MKGTFKEGEIKVMRRKGKIQKEEEIVNGRREAEIKNREGQNKTRKRKRTRNEK